MRVARSKAWIAWSTGKDCAWALHAARQQDELEVVGMLATITRPYGRVSMHGVREELLAAQAEAAGLPLHRVMIPADCTDEVYGAAMREAMEEARAGGVAHVVFGDVCLEDVRKYREARLAEINMTGCFPLWGRDPGALAREMIAGGLRACVTCLDPRKVPRGLAGRAFDGSFLAALPDGADPCGERGEFHTFAWDGPVFSRPIPVRLGETVEREGFVFTDLLPAGPRPSLDHTG